MAYKGKAKNGVVLLEGDVSPPENAEVNAELVDPGASQPPPSWAEVSKDAIGTVDDLLPRMAANHDLYIHGTIKQ